MSTAGKDFLKHERGQTLIEILIASVVASILFVGVASLVIVALRASRSSRDVSFAETEIQDMSAAVRSLASQNWQSFWGSQGLVAYWALDEGVNEKIFDPVNGNSGTINLGSAGNTSLANAWQLAANCIVGQCLSFDGIDDYVNVPIASSLQISGAITLSFWMYANAANTDSGLVGTGIGSGYQCTFNTGNVVDCYIQSGSNNVNASASTGVWHHIAFTWDGTTGVNGMKLYIDGALVSQNTSTINSMSGWGDLRFGFATTYLNGRLDDVRIYNRALSATEVSNLYNAPGKLYPQNIGGLWQIGEGEQAVSTGGTNMFRSFAVGAVQRDSLGNIVSSGGSADPSTELVTYYVRWGMGQSVSTQEYITRAQTKIIIQNDWSGGPGYSGPTAFPTNQYFSASNINYSTQGQVSLSLVASSTYASQGNVISSIFDSGALSGAALNGIMWQGTLPSGGVVEFQVANSNSSSGPWNYVGPDGTGNTYYQPAGPNTPLQVDRRYHTGYRFFRYELFLNPSPGATPIVNDVVLNASL